MADIVTRSVAVQSGGKLVSAEEVVSTFGKVLLDAEYARQQLAEQNDYVALAHGLHAFRNMRAQLDILLRAIEDDVASLMPDKKVVIDNFATLERKSTTSRKWDSENLLQHIVRMALDPDFTGEIKYENVFDLIQLLKEVLPFTQSTGWRVTALREHNVPIDQFSETSYGRQTITIL